MTVAERLEHTLLKPEAQVGDIMRLCAEALQYKLAAVCVNPCYAGLARHLLNGSDVRVVTVVGFPLGADRTAVKALAARMAVEEDHVDEIDMVMNLAAFKSGNYDGVVEDIAAVVQAAAPYPVKVIIETCLLTDEEKRIACGLVARGGAAYVKTSTGFNSGGATEHDVRLLAEEAAKYGLKVKAAGGIRNLADAQNMLSAGADRIGTSAGAAIAAEEA